MNNIKYPMSLLERYMPFIYSIIFLVIIVGIGSFIINEIIFFLNNTNIDELLNNCVYRNKGLSNF